MASDLKSDLVSKSYDMGPDVKLMGNPAVMAKMCHGATSRLDLIVLFPHCAGKTTVTKNLLNSNTLQVAPRVTVKQICS